MIADALEGIEGLQLRDQYVFSQSPLKIPANERKAITRMQVLKSFAEQYSTLGKVVLPREYHLNHHMFNRNVETEPYKESDLDLYENIHNSKGLL